MRRSVQVNYGRRNLAFWMTAIVLTAATMSSATTTTISGSVSYSPKCAQDVNLPCIQMLMPVEGCTVTVSTLEPIPETYPLPDKYKPRTAITDKNGAFSIIYESSAETKVAITASKGSLGIATPMALILSGKDITVDLILQATPFKPKPSVDSATITGVVISTSKEVVPQCTVSLSPMYVPFMYPLPDAYKPRITITDNNGAFSFKVLSGDYLVSASDAKLGNAQAKAFAQPNETVTVNLLLENTGKINPDPTDPSTISPSGHASIKGTVTEILDPLPGDGITQVKPVVGCTVVVCAAISPFMLAGSSEPSSGIEPFDVISASTASVVPEKENILERSEYRTITDANGNFVFLDIPLWGSVYSALIMARKGEQFGAVQADLIDGKTVTADIIVVKPTFADVPVAGKVTYPEIYKDYYDILAKTAQVQVPNAINLSVVRTNSTAVTIHGIINGNLRLNLPVAKRLTVKALTLNGRLIATLANNHLFDAGIQSLPIARMLSGPMLIKVQGEDFSSVVEVNIVRSR